MILNQIYMFMSWRCENWGVWSFKKSHNCCLFIWSLEQNIKGLSLSRLLKIHKWIRQCFWTHLNNGNIYMAKWSLSFSLTHMHTNTERERERQHWGKGREMWYPYYYYLHYVQKKNSIFLTQFLNPGINVYIEPSGNTDVVR